MKVDGESGADSVRVAPSVRGTDGDEPWTPYGRRWGDRRPELPEAGFAAFLAKRPPLSSALQYLTALLSWPTGTAATALYRRRDDRFELVASFSADLPAVDPERSRATERRLDAVFGAGSAVRAASWALDDGTSATHVDAWLLGAPASTWGALTLDVPVAVPDRFLRAHMAHLVDLLSLYLASDPPGADAPPADRAGPQVTQHPPSERQRQVLRFLADGLTMRQIAVRIGYSESTVRAEALALYRKLAVHTREQAVAAGRSRGLLP